MTAKRPKQERDDARENQADDGKVEKRSVDAQICRTAAVCSFLYFWRRCNGHTEKTEVATGQQLLRSTFDLQPARDEDEDEMEEALRREPLRPGDRAAICFLF